MSDIFAAWATSLDSPASHAAAITTSDSVDLDTSTRALYVGSAGDVKVTLVGGDTVTFAAVQGGTVLPLRVARVFATGTTAASLVGIW